MKILYVEDNYNDATLVERYGQSIGHDVRITDTLEQARAEFNEKYDLILIDLVLGQQRVGYMLANELRGQGYDGPMIAVTALNTPADMLDCEQAGFDAVLNKPFEISDLDRIIHLHM